jgi:hypothetical protein
LIGGGQSNTIQANALHSVIVGGKNHSIGDADNSYIGGGNNNDISAGHVGAFIGGGEINKIQGIGGNSGWEVIVGGYGNVINQGAWESFIGGGESNTIAANARVSTIVGGYYNSVADADFAFVGGGNDNDIGSANYSTIVGGSDNDIATGGNFSTIVGGNLNNMGIAEYAFIGGGYGNDIYDAPFVTIGGGQNNDIATGATHSSILGGKDHNIADADFAVVGGGNNNDIGASSGYAAILSGESNTIGTGAGHAFIGSGISNSIGNNATQSVIVGGWDQDIAAGAVQSTIVGGTSHRLNDADYAFIGAGHSNTITVGSDISTISGGQYNTIDNYSAFATIGGGFTNKVGTSTGTADYSGVFGGFQNTIASGQYSAILGGSNNSATGSHVSIIGSTNTVNALNGTAIGISNSVTGTDGMSIGTSNTVSAANGIAIGNSSSVTGSNGMAIGNSAVAGTNQLSSKFSAGHVFEGQGTSIENHVAKFYNPTDGNGIMIQVNRPTANNNNNFVTFKNASGSEVGRIEGQTQAELNNSDQYTRELALYESIIDGAQTDIDKDGKTLGIELASLALDIADVVIGFVQLGGSAACASSPFTLNCAGLVPGAVANSIQAILTVAGGVIAVGEASANLGISVNSKSGAVDLKNAWYNDRVANLGVTYESGSADYAEWLLKLDPTEKFEASDVVGVRHGKITKNTDGAEQLMVISTKPIVLGNMPEKGQEKNYEKVAFLGQVPVRVLGKVSLGDYIIPSGGKNGFAVAVPPEYMTPSDFKRVVGVAWSSGNEKAPYSLINVAVGMNHHITAGIIQQQAKEIENLKTVVSQTEKRMNNIDKALTLILPNYQNAMAVRTSFAGDIMDIQQALNTGDDITNSANAQKFITEIQSDTPRLPKGPGFFEDTQILDGYNQIMKSMAESGNMHPMIEKMEKDPKYKEVMLAKVKQLLTKGVLDEIIKNSSKKQ